MDNVSFKLVFELQILNSYFIFRENYLVQLIEQPILLIPNFPK